VVINDPHSTPPGEADLLREIPQRVASRRRGFKLGGALDDDSTTYVRRRADDDLASALAAKKYCYVLNARQMGKSSMRVQATKALVETGSRVAMIDVSTLQEQSERDWYWSFIGKLAGELKLKERPEFGALRDERASLASPELLSRFISEVLLTCLTQNLVIFIEEIDSTLTLGFSLNGFFATLRECHERRPLDHRYRNLTFVLIGVARPDELARDHRTTPFNVARGIDLIGFRRDELAPLRAELPDVVNTDAVVSQRLPPPRRLLLIPSVWSIS
jgi:hypothetical protein